MSDQFPSVEVEDIQGTSLQAVANIGVAPIAFPVTPNSVISSLSISVPRTANFGEYVEWSIDNVFYERVERREFRSQNFKQNVTQLWFKASAASVPLQVFINFEPAS